MNILKNERTPIGSVVRGMKFKDGLMTFDSQTIDSAGSFLIGELERLDQRL